MAVSKAQQKAVNKYVKSNYDRIELVVKPKGRKEDIKTHASAMGETLNSFITRAINETMERDGFPTAAAEPQNEPQSEPQSKPQSATHKTDLPDYLTPDILAHIDARRYLSGDMAYQFEIGSIIGMDHLSDLADYLKQQAAINKS